MPIATTAPHSPKILMIATPLLHCPSAPTSDNIHISLSTKVPALPLGTQHYERKERNGNDNKTLVK